MKKPNFYKLVYILIAIAATVTSAILIYYYLQEDKLEINFKEYNEGDYYQYLGWTVEGGSNKSISYLTSVVESKNGSYTLKTEDNSFLTSHNSYSYQDSKLYSTYSTYSNGTFYYELNSSDNYMKYPLSEGDSWDINRSKLGFCFYNGKNLSYEIYEYGEAKIYREDIEISLGQFDCLVVRENFTRSVIIKNESNIFLENYENITTFEYYTDGISSFLIYKQYKDGNFVKYLELYDYMQGLDSPNILVSLDPTLGQYWISKNEDGNYLAYKYIGDTIYNNTDVYIYNQTNKNYNSISYLYCKKDSGGVILSESNSERIESFPDDASSNFTLSVGKNWNYSIFQNRTDYGLEYNYNISRIIVGGVVRNEYILRDGKIKSSLYVEIYEYNQEGDLLVKYMQWYEDLGILSPAKEQIIYYNLNDIDSSLVVGRGKSDNKQNTFSDSDNDGKVDILEGY